MRQIILIGPFLISTILFGQRIAQKGENWRYSSGVEFRQWYCDEFREHNFKKIETYIYKIKDGIQQNDSVLLYRQEVNFDSLMVSGIKLTGSEYENSSWDKCKTYFNQNGQMTRHLESPLTIEWKQKKDKLEMYNPIEEYKCEYDSSHRLVKETYNHYSYTYSIATGGQDTGILILFHPEIDEYFYNESGQKIKRYCTDDSTRYLRTNIQHYASWCSNCDPRHLNMEWFYNDNGLLEKDINYTRKGTVNEKSYYFYDNQYRLIKQIDSTGWSYPVNPPNVKSNRNYVYLDSIKIKTETYNSKITDLYNENTYDFKGRELSDCTYYKNDKTCRTSTYKDVDGLLVYEAETDNDGNRWETFYKYDNREQLVERKESYNSQLKKLIRYFYN